MLDLTGNEICGVRSSGTEPFNAYVVRMVCGLIRREGGGLRRLRLKGNHLIGNDIYTNEAVLLLAEALRSPHCVLEELHLGLANKGAGLREEEGLLLGVALQRCAALVRLSVTRAELPMGELLNGSTSLDLEGKVRVRVRLLSLTLTPTSTLTLTLTQP